MVRRGRPEAPLLAVEGGDGLAVAQLLASLRAAGLAMPVKDSLIATALVHGLTVVTRNRRMRKSRRSARSGSRQRLRFT